MRCDDCGKKKATVHLTELIDGKISELHLCEDCAKSKSLQMEQQFGLADLLAGLSDFNKTATPAESGEKAVKIDHCASCGLTYEDFRKYGRLGCSECYTHFRGRLSSLLKKIHGAAHHVGKAPQSVVKEPSAAPAATGAAPIDELKKQLQQAVLCEDYEKAAELRDRIRGMEQGGASAS